MIPLPAVEQHGRFWVVRDDRTPGGTKARVALELFSRAAPDAELVYGGPAEGYAQVAMGYAAAATGRRATYFVARRKRRHARTVEAELAGARIFEIAPPAYLTVVHARARAYADHPGRELLPFGFDCPTALDAIAATARALVLSPGTPTEVWCAAGTGTLSRALQEAWPNAAHHAVQVGKPPDAGAARVWQVPERFSEVAREPPPFPSCSNYDAKVWRLMLEHASPAAFFWNVAA